MWRPAITGPTAARPTGRGNRCNSFTRLAENLADRVHAGGPPGAGMTDLLGLVLVGFDGVGDVQAQVAQLQTQGLPGDPE
jgi:hypothetical protein